MMKPKRTAVRLSPNEEAAILKKKKEERRKVRLLQVREQDRCLAQRMREGVNTRKERERCLLESHVAASLASAHQKELRDLENRYLSRVKSMGQGHRAAQEKMEEENRLQELRLCLEAEQKWRADSRYKAAMKELNTNKLQEEEHKKQSVENRKKTMRMEKERAIKVIQRPSSQPLILDFTAGKKKGHRVQFKEADSYSSSYYHIPHTLVQRDPPTTCSAHRMAQEKNERREQLERQAALTKLEQDEKARLRHNHAMARVRLEKDKVELMSQLKMMEREDRAHRRKALAKMPNNIFQPVHQRLEEASEQQRDMEQAFEKLFVRFHHDAHPHQHLDVRSQPDATEGEELSPIQATAAGQEEASANIPDKAGAVSPQKTVQFSQTPDSPATDVSLHLTLPAGVEEGDTASSSTVLSSDDISPHSGHPLPTSSPPRHPLASTRHHHPLATSTLSPPTPTRQFPPTITTAPAEEEDSQLDLSSKFTQTQRPVYQRPELAAHLLSRPDLSVSDTASSTTSTTRRALKFQSKREPGGLGTGITSAKPPRPPNYKVSNETMQKLISVVQQQQKEWEERRETESRLSNKPSHEKRPAPSNTEQVEERRGDSSSSGTQQASLSISTLSARESAEEVGGIATPLDEEDDQPTGTPPPVMQTSTRSNTHSPAPLSISQYHTTPDVSLLSSQPPSEGPPPPAHQTTQDSIPLSITTYNTTLDVSSVQHLTGLSSYSVPISEGTPEATQNMHAASSSSSEQCLATTAGDNNDVDADTSLFRPRVNYATLEAHNLSAVSSSVTDLPSSSAPARPDAAPLDALSRPVATTSTDSPLLTAGAGRPKVGYTTLDLHNDLSMSTTTDLMLPPSCDNMVDSGGGGVQVAPHGDSELEVSEMEFPVCTTTTTGTDRILPPFSFPIAYSHLTAPSLNVTASSVTTEALEFPVCTTGTHQTLPLYNIPITYSHLTAPSLNVTASSITTEASDYPAPPAELRVVVGHPPPSQQQQQQQQQPQDSSHLHYSSFSNTGILHPLQSSLRSDISMGETTGAVNREQNAAAIRDGDTVMDDGASMEAGLVQGAQVHPSLHINKSSIDEEESCSNSSGSSSGSSSSNRDSESQDDLKSSVRATSLRYTAPVPPPLSSPQSYTLLKEASTPPTGLLRPAESLLNTLFQTADDMPFLHGEPSWESQQQTSSPLSSPLKASTFSPLDHKSKSIHQSLPHSSTLTTSPEQQGFESPEEHHEVESQDHHVPQSSSFFFLSQQKPSSPDHGQSPHQHTQQEHDDDGDDDDDGDGDLTSSCSESSMESNNMADRYRSLNVSDSGAAGPFKTVIPTNDPAHQETPAPEQSRKDPETDLQEAFSRKKLGFIKRSQERMKNLKESAAERQQRTGARKTQRPAKDKSISPTTHRTMLVSDKASGPADKKSVSKEGWRPAVLSSRKREKIRMREMKERNLRLYNRLPEVKEKHKQEKRAKAYAENRERAKAYHQYIRTKLKT